MEYDKEFEYYFKSAHGEDDWNEAFKQNIFRAWQAARKDHYRIGEEVENILTGERAEVKAVLSFTDSITHINPTSVRRIPAKPRIDKIAEEAVDKYKRGAVNAGDLKDIIKAAILKDREEREANR